MKSHVLVFIDEAGNEYSDTFSEVRHNGRFEEYQYNGMGYEYMQNLLEAIFLNKVNKWNQRICKSVIFASTI